MLAWVGGTKQADRGWLSNAGFGLRVIEEVCGVPGTWRRVCWREIEGEEGVPEISFVNE